MKFYSSLLIIEMPASLPLGLVYLSQYLWTPCQSTNNMRVIYMKTNSIGTIMNTSRDAHSNQVFAYFSHRYLMTLIDSFHCKPRARTQNSNGRTYHESVADSYSALISFYLFIISSHCAVGDGCILVIRPYRNEKYQLH